jgi:two-component system sensor histidine kinase HydH
MTTAIAKPVITGPPGVTPGELAELLSAFNEVTGRLQGTHEALRREVVRLQDELRDANEQLQRSKRLAALGQMAAGIAHEVRNPLGSIRLYARMLEQDLGDRPSERAIASKIAAAVQGLDGVVGDVLNFSRELKACVQDTEPGELLDRALEACWASDPAGAAGVKVVQREVRQRGGIRNGVRARLACDPALMHQALVNIIRNALQAMAGAPAPEGGHTLTLESGPWRDDDGRAAFMLSMADTGPGVSKDVVDRMFNPFFTTRATGTGLGLAIVHRIIDAHGGRISVKNDSGARFTILLPASGAAGAARNKGNGRGKEAPAQIEQEATT